MAIADSSPSGMNVQILASRQCIENHDSQASPNPFQFEYPEYVVVHFHGGGRLCFIFVRIKYYNLVIRIEALLDLKIAIIP